jgi:peptidoglycan hydrolase CwlO-like protein
MLRNKFDEREDAFESLQDQLELLQIKLHEREDEIEQSRNENNHLRSQIDNATRDLSEENEALHECLTSRRKSQFVETQKLNTSSKWIKANFDEC